MSYKAVPIDMISAPNFYAEFGDGMWVIAGTSAVTLWLQLNIVDALGERRFITGNSAVLQAIFQRSDLFAQQNNQLTQTPRSLTKTATAHAQDKSLFSIALTSQDVQTIVGGSIKFTLTDTSINDTWIQDWIVQKKLIDPGF
jgi:hypothetical protein